MNWQNIHDHLRKNCLRRAELDADDAKWLREGERAKIWRQFARPNMLAYMEWCLGYTPRVALERLRVARALADLPATEQALATGKMPFSAIREITRVATTETESEWLAAAADKTVRDVEQLVSGHAKGDRPNDVKKPELMLRTLFFHVSPETFALYRQVRNVLQNEVGHPLDDDAVLAILLRRALEAPDSDKPIHQTAVTICEICKRAWQDGGGVAVEIGAAAAELARCDAQDIGSIDAAKPSRARSTIPPKTRRLVKRRDHGRCGIDGCRSSRNLDIHHIVPRAEGGTDAPSNLITCCSAHHRAIHDGRLIVTGTAGKLSCTHVGTRKAS